MHILGISTLGRGSAVALLNETSVLFAIEEEKLNRLEDTLEIPRLALARCLKENQLQLSDCRAIAVAERLSRTSNSPTRRSRLSPTITAEQLRALLRGGPRPSHFDHHLCHAASAYYTSDFDRALILSLDQGTSSQSGLIALGEGDEIQLRQSLDFPDSLGWFYSRVTELAGLRPNRDEHKLQWLRRDGEPEFLSAFSKLFSWRPSGLPALNRRYFAAGPDRRGVFSPQFYREFGLSSRNLTLSPSLRANLARSAQDFLEEIVLQLAANFQQSTGARSLVLAGGVFLNVLLVRALETRGSFDHVYVQPVAGNAGTALGAAYLSRKKITGR
jgi:carbamoyltransferase